MKYHHTKSDNGFTLVELAISMVIIGLLIGAIMKGQELIENARSTKTSTQLEALQAAAYTFRDTYNFLPGDHALATTRIPNCSVASFCANGDGDGNVGEVGAALNNFLRGQSGAANAQQMETVQFWKHLTLADLLSSLNGQANPANTALGETHPKSHLSGGYAILTQSFSASGVSQGLFLRLQNGFPESNAANVVGVNGENPLSPKSLLHIENKIDDGNPTTGYILGIQQTDGGTSQCGFETNPAGSSFTNTGPNFDFASKDKKCVLLYRLE